MELQDILYEKRGPAAWITLNRPTVLNALSPALVRSLKQACTDAQEDAQVRAVVFTGAGRGFCAGADISTMEHTRLDDFRTFLHELAATWSLIRTLPKPTIAAINGRGRWRGLRTDSGVRFPHCRKHRPHRVGRGQYQPAHDQRLHAYPAPPGWRDQGQGTWHDGGYYRGYRGRADLACSPPAWNRMRSKSVFNTPGRYPGQPRPDCHLSGQTVLCPQPGR